MNSDREQNEQLLAELFHDDWSAGPAAGFARRAAAHARHRRRLRSLSVAGASTAFVVALLLALTRRHTPPSIAAAPATLAPAYEIISDAELLAQLHDRPLLILQKQNGAREFVLLDR